MNIDLTAKPVRRPSVWLLAGCLAATLLSAQVQASGDGANESDNSIKLNCPKGKVYNPKTKSCTIQQSSLNRYVNETYYAYLL
ncbi:hypothetical protein QN382_10780 [Pseudomonas sp. 10B1]|uniref:hypothetical protein n=1 Tax=unclassified Pseudomonas TaxID=196821 RepID=UPI002AB5C179|nr:MULTISPECIES: hypothetical protein [unclassified Pseudomonas]MDY7560254.1 hypothetical protein [Pseudomonas sp. AB6]MEA9975631.1 hypothetical protein [Pseudomonas sp. RTS4]MEA9993884.1 hypothetical protein [Pseudomonas sp. AA4]MEB0085436.1 hypothetical protein [Pseudomonas sp. RTI1]MEB0124498.1 hypothetical protein [Pseudomonas sp. CCC1.2]